MNDFEKELQELIEIHDRERKKLWGKNKALPGLDNSMLEERVLYDEFLSSVQRLRKKYGMLPLKSKRVPG